MGSHLNGTIVTIFAVEKSDCMGAAVQRVVCSQTTYRYVYALRVLRRLRGVLY